MNSMGSIDTHTHDPQNKMKIIIFYLNNFLYQFVRQTHPLNYVQGEMRAEEDEVVERKFFLFSLLFCAFFWFRFL